MITVDMPFSVLPSAHENDSPDTAKVQELMSACHCSEEEAIRLLTYSNNVEEAKDRHDIETLYGISRARTKNQVHHLPEEYGFDFLSDDSFDEEPTLITRRSSKVHPSGPKTVTKRPPPPPKKPQKLRSVIGPKNESANTKKSLIILSSPRGAQEFSHFIQDGPSEAHAKTTSHSTSESNGVVEIEPIDKESPFSLPVPTEPSNEASNLGNSTSQAISNEPPLIPKEDFSPSSQILEDHVIENPANTISQPEDPTLEDTEELEWNFILPVIPAPLSLTPRIGEGTDGFSLQDLIGAIQHDIDVHSVAEYLGHYDSDVVRRNLCDTLEGFPSIFFAVGTNNESLIRMWITFGADVSAIHETSKVPLLAFAIMNSEQPDTDTTLTVSTLLSLGASPEVIPSAFYRPFIQDIPEKGPSDESLEQDMEDKTNSWCTPTARAKLARTINLTQRYYLERASKAKKPSRRYKQVAKLHSAEALLGIQYFLIGQAMVTNRLFQNLLNHMMMSTKRPLVMVFAGPSGHGKTELVRTLGRLMSLDLELVNCAIYNREIDLFGPRNPNAEAEQGSPLNNFLAKNSGKRCIVVLDKFEKVTSDICQTFLAPFDNGEYQDRRDLKRIDCSKTIWILATNALDQTIQSFCKLNHEPIFEDDDESEKLRLITGLSKVIKEDFLFQFGAPITGRISDFLPFLPFTPGEQAVIVHKFLLELRQKIGGPVNLIPSLEEQFLGNVRLRIRNDASVCRILAEEEYHPDLGARSLVMGARKLEDILIEAYLEVDGDICETDKMVDFVVDVHGSEVIAKMVDQGSEATESS